MKCLAAVAVMIAGLSVGAFAQRSGFHGGFSGSRGGFSGSHMGFSGARPGSFYSVFPHGLLVTVFGIAFLFACAAIALSARRFREELNRGQIPRSEGKNDGDRSQERGICPLSLPGQ